MSALREKFEKMRAERHTRRPLSSVYFLPEHLPSMREHALPVPLDYRADGSLTLSYLERQVAANYPLEAWELMLKLAGGAGNVVEGRVQEVVKAASRVLGEGLSSHLQVQRLRALLERPRVEVERRGLITITHYRKESSL